MSEFQFGDILKYRDRDTSDYRFMFINTQKFTGWTGRRILVLHTARDDDQWVAGETILSAGINEMVLADE